MGISFCRGILVDLKARQPFYLDDFIVGLKSPKVLSSSLFCFFVSLLPSITFAALLNDTTQGEYGIIETIFSTSLCGIIFALTGGQPLVLFGVTGNNSCYFYFLYFLLLFVIIVFFLLFLLLLDFLIPSVIKNNITWIFLILQLTFRSCGYFKCSRISNFRTNSNPFPSIHDMYLHLVGFNAFHSCYYKCL